MQHVSSDQSTPSESEGRILPFPGPGNTAAGAQQRRFAAGDDSTNESPVAGLEKYEREGDDDDYRHRMLMNVLAFGFVVLLVLAGVWIADRIALMRKNQDCVLSGRRGCTPVEVQPRERF